MFSFVFIFNFHFIFPLPFVSAGQTLHLFEKGNVNGCFLWDFSCSVDYISAHYIPFCVSIRTRMGRVAACRQATSNIY